MLRSELNRWGLEFDRHWDFPLFSSLAHLSKTTVAGVGSVGDSDSYLLMHHHRTMWLTNGQLTDGSTCRESAASKPLPLPV